MALGEELFCILIATESSQAVSGVTTQSMYEECSQWCLVEAGDVSGTSAIIFVRPQLLVGSDRHCDLYVTVRVTLLYHTHSVLEHAVTN